MLFQIHTVTRRKGLPLLSCLEATHLRTRPIIYGLMWWELPYENFGWKGIIGLFKVLIDLLTKLRAHSFVASSCSVIFKSFVTICSLLFSVSHLD